MNILTAINNEKIFKELKKQKNINIISNDIQYKEGILEILEKYKKIQCVIINEKISGQIKIEELIKQIKNINKEINIIIILNKKDVFKEEYLLKNKIKFIYTQNLSTEKILEKIIFDKNKTICILGNHGSGKTIFTLILSKILAKYKNKKILIIEDNIKNNSIFDLYKKEENKTIKINENIFLLNIKSILINNKKDRIKIINEINKIKENYNYIFIDTQNIGSYKIYKEITTKNILILNSNILEINKIKKFVINNNIKLKVVLNNYNENSISDKILKSIFKNKIDIIEKIKNNKNYNLIINNNFNIKYLDQKTENKYFNIIKNI